MHKYNNSSSAGFNNTKHGNSLNKSGFKDYASKMSDKILSNSPLFKLGEALRNLNERDTKALKLM